MVAVAHWAEKPLRSKFMLKGNLNQYGKPLLKKEVEIRFMNLKIQMSMHVLLM
ncbi:hypothetical protein OPIT5_23630 [Opitutaceae bacterium TAV5]|nr:hypothetical protein OPIT5_23630 [Opitutaceae bacterium TAV5]